MAILKKLSAVGLAAAFMLTMAVVSAEAQLGRYWYGDNGRHLGWYKRKKRDRKVRVVRYRTYPRYVYTYPTRVYYPVRRYYTPVYRPVRSGLFINLRF